jgi:hypothetical protein
LTTTDDEASAAASARVAALLDAQMPMVELGIVVVAPPDAERMAARDRARAAAIAAGRGPLLEDAMRAAREVTMRSFARAGFSGTWAVTEMAASVTRSGDRVAAAAAFEEAAAAAVVEDLVDTDTLETLRATSDELGRATGMATPGSLAGFAAPVASAAHGPFQVLMAVFFVVVCVAVAAVVDLGLGLLVLAVGGAIIAGVTRARPRSEP